MSGHLPGAENVRLVAQIVAALAIVSLIVLAALYATRALGGDDDRIEAEGGSLFDE